MKIVLTPAEVNHIVTTHLVMESKLEPNIPTDCTWRINQFNVAHSELVYSQEEVNKNVEIS